MNLVTLLRQPFPCYATMGSKLRMAVFFGIFITVFLLLFKPFDLDTFAWKQLVIIVLAYGLITFVCVFVSTVLLPKMFPSFFDESHWTTGRQIIFTFFIVVLVGLANYLFSPLLVNTRLNVKDAIWFQGITMAVALLPISIFILIRQNQLLKTYTERAQILEKKLQEKQQEKPVQPIPMVMPVTLVGDYQNEKVEVEPDNLFLITSASNYIKIYHRDNGKLTYSIIRSTIRKTEETLAVHSNFFKCHRAFIINLDKVAHVEGNAQGYRVRMEAHEELIPVSRNLNSEFSDRLLAFRKQTG